MKKKNLIYDIFTTVFNPSLCFNPFKFQIFFESFSGGIYILQITIMHYIKFSGASVSKNCNF